MKIFHSLRWRIQLWHGSFLFLVLVGLGIAAWRFEKTSSLKRLDEDLQKRLAVIQDSLPAREEGRPPPPEDDFGPPGRPARFAGNGRPDRPPRPDGNGPPDRPPYLDADGPPNRPPRERRDFSLPDDRQIFFDPKDPAGFYYVIWRRDGEVATKAAHASADIPRPARPLPGELRTTIRERGDQRETFSFTPPGECLLVGCSTQTQQAALRRFAWQLIGLESGILLLGLAGGWWFTSRSLMPLDHITATSHAVADGHLNERIAILQMDSELGQLSAQLNNTFGKLETAFAKQARFTSDAAHELKTPLSVIISQAQLAMRGERDPAEYREMFEACLRSAKRMQNLTKSLLELARMDNSTLPPDRIPTDLSGLATEALSIVELAASEKRITITPSLSSAPCLAESDSVLRVMLNLLGNAIDHCPEETTIAVTTGIRDGHAFISVEDNGPGIPQADIPHIFDRFYRVDQSRNRKTGGTGLGLAICKAIAESHGGTLTVTSKVNRGSLFTLSLDKM